MRDINFRSKKVVSEKPKKVKKSYRKLVSIIVWSSLVFLLLFSVISILRSIGYTSSLETIHLELENLKAVQEELKIQTSSVDSPDQVEKAEEINLVNLEGAKLFACSFAKDYYTWTYENKVEERNLRLEQYVNADWKSVFDISELGIASTVKHAEVYEIQQAGSNKCVVTVRIYGNLTTIDNEKKEVEQGSYVKYLVVPLITDGINFRVSDTPYLVAAPSDKDIPITEDKKEQQEVTDSEVLEKIKTFIPVFLKVYTEGTQSELDYYTKTSLESVSNLYKVKEVKSIKVYSTDSSSVFSSVVDVNFTETDTGAIVNLSVTLTLEKGQDKYIVTDIEY